MHDDIARQNFTHWNEALQTGNPDTVAELYAEDAAFLPTVSPDFKEGRDGARNYFVHFLAKHPVGTINAERVQPLGDGAYLHSGMYTFAIDDGEGGRTSVEARFTFLWKNNGAEWQIHHHHSSIRPTG